MSSYIAEVNTAGDPEGVFTGNMLRFATADEANGYVTDLAMRWTGVRDWRVTPSDDEVSHVWTSDGLRNVTAPEGSERMPARRVQL